MSQVRTTMVDGVLSGIIDAKAFRAELDSRESAQVAHQARMDTLDAERKVRLLSAELRAERAKSVQGATLASAGLIVVNAMLKAVENLPAEEGKKFLADVAKLSKDRIKVVDVIRAKNGFLGQTIEAEFALRPEYTQVGLDKF